MRNLFPLALFLVFGMAAAEEFKGWRILKGTVAQTETRVQSLDALDNIKLTFDLTKRGRRLDGSGEPTLSVLCDTGGNGTLAVLVTGTNSPEGLAGRVSVGVRFDGAAPKTMQWILTGNIYQPTEQLESKQLAVQFLTSKQLDLILALRTNATQLGPNDVQMLVFDLDGFAEAAAEMRRTCPF